MRQGRLSRSSKARLLSAWHIKALPQTDHTRKDETEASWNPSPPSLSSLPSPAAVVRSVFFPIVWIERVLLIDSACGPHFFFCALSVVNIVLPSAICAVAPQSLFTPLHIHPQ